ncbi:hypothetical protein LSH36_327g01004 [Paralvinella palmiformis]|uniref:Proline dehydrogenase n=1 Tax=Paralvinella palmiformis TaxID=53620 RepID=A0AAD9JG21_9ANNE|nr:hypothetical protein LSH36_327g01004 [Paralvinella palmiformis]
MLGICGSRVSSWRWRMSVLRQLRIEKRSKSTRIDADAAPYRVRCKPLLHRRAKFSRADGHQGNGVPTPDFRDVKFIYRNKNWKQLLRSFFVFTLASWPLLANNHLKILKWSRQLAGKRLFKTMMRATVYGQFMAGESPDDVLDVAKDNTKAGIYAMFAYTASEQHGQTSVLKVAKTEEVSNKDNYMGIIEGLQVAAAAREFSIFTPQLSTKLTFFVPLKLLVSLNSLVTHQTKILEGVVNDPDLHRLSEFNQFLLTVIDGVKNNYHGNDMILPQSNLYIPNGSGSIRQAVACLAQPLWWSPSP